MPSWRDELDETDQADLDGLLEAALPFAQEMLAEHGEFYPFAVKVTLDGEQQVVAADPGSGDNPESTEVLEVLWAGLVGSRDGARATAVVSDVRAPTSDAVRVELEHRTGVAMSVLLPYRKKRFSKKVEYGDLSAGRAERRVWV